MTNPLKSATTRVGRILAAPVRMAKEHRYADAEAGQQQHKDLPNDRLLPLVRRFINEGHTVTLAVKGYSMRPFLEHIRDQVTLDAFDELHVGDAVLAEIVPGHFVLHRIIDMTGDGWLTLMGDGNIQGTEHCHINDVCGIVTEYIRPNNHVTPASNRWLRWRIRQWRRLLPIRRYLLYIYRLTI